MGLDRAADHRPAAPHPRSRRLLSTGLASAAGGPVAARYRHRHDRCHLLIGNPAMKPFLRRIALNSGRPALTLLIVVGGLVAGRYLCVYYQEEPWTRDGRVRADVVTIAPDVSGLITEVAVKDNQPVKRG